MKECRVICTFSISTMVGKKALDYILIMLVLVILDNLGFNWLADL